jgi:hypothetical protein
VDDVGKRGLIAASDNGFGRFESHYVVVAGLVPAATTVKAVSKDDHRGRDKPGYDAPETQDSPYRFTTSGRRD